MLVASVLVMQYERASKSKKSLKKGIKKKISQKNIHICATSMQKDFQDEFIAVVHVRYVQTSDIETRTHTT